VLPASLSIGLASLGGLDGFCMMVILWM